MAQPTNLNDSYAGVGIREDVSDLIHNISPTETPFLSAIGTTTATQRSHQWQTDVLRAPDGGNAHIEGDTTIGLNGQSGLESRAQTTMVGNYTQISKITFGVSGTYEVSDKYGRDSEMAYQAAKAAREIKTDVDAAMTGVNAGSVAGNPTTARISGSFETWLATNNDLGATGSIPGFSGGTTTARTPGTPRSFAQSQLDAVIRSAWQNGGKPTLIIAGPVQKENLSKFDGLGNGVAENVTRSDRAQRTIYATADIYVSNFGRLQVVPSRHVTADAAVDSNVYCVDPEYAKTAYLRPWQQYDLAKVGDSIQREMLVEWTLEVCNEKAHGIIADLN